MDTKYSPLFEPLTFRRGVGLKSRIVMAPMTTGSADPDDNVSDAEAQWYARRARGVSMVVTACTYVTPNGKGFWGEFGAETDERMPSLRRLATTIKEQGAVAVLQIFHGGRMCPPALVPNGDVVAPSDIPAEAGGESVPGRSATLRSRRSSGRSATPPAGLSRPATTAWRSMAPTGI